MKRMIKEKGVKVSKLSEDLLLSYTYIYIWEYQICLLYECCYLGDDLKLRSVIICDSLYAAFCSS